MLKKYSSLLLMLFASSLLYAQLPSKTAYEQYLDFNLLRLQGEHAASLDMGVALLDSVDKLPAKSRISFYNSLAKLYEDQDQPERATPYYEKVTAAEPKYYVAHRALGYIYLNPANDIFAKLTATKPNTPAYTRLKGEYVAAATKAIKHLEVAQACDPSDDTLTIIKTLYKNIGDTASVDTLDERLKALSKDCLDILSDS
jgi:tetratricopeptide (TPR) repeat protein